MSKFTPVPLENAVHLWSSVEPVLERAVSRNGGFTMNDILQHVSRGTMQMWLSIQDNEIEAVGITKIEVYPQKKTCLLLFVAGKDYENWKPYLKDLEEWAVKIGCTELKFIGRKGWARIITDYDDNNVMYTKQLRVSS